jgi:hypothetical protein
MRSLGRCEEDFYISCFRFPVGEHANEMITRALALDVAPANIIALIVQRKA